MKKPHMLHVEFGCCHKVVVEIRTKADLEVAHEVWDHSVDLCPACEEDRYLEDYADNRYHPNDPISRAHHGRGDCE
jgi:hypothetical protein